MNLEDNIKSLNNMIDEAKERYNRGSCIDEGILEFPTEDDLQRFIASCVYEKVEAIKELCDNKDVNSLKVSNEDKKLIFKILNLINIMPDEMHKCIGCPCLENDYPNCEKCIFIDSCLSGNSPYPDTCNEGDCFNTFRWIENSMNFIESQITNI